MKDYGRFVESRRKEWADARAELDALERFGLSGLEFAALEGFVARHRKLSADLGLAQSRWAGSEAESTLRGLVLAGHRLIAPRAPSLFRRALRFLVEEYPAEFRARTPSLLLAILVFCGGGWLGFVLCSLNEGVAAILVGPEALAMLRQGRIWTDGLGDESSALLAVQIFVNNILVGLGAWAGGVLWGLGSVVALLRNGALVGAIVAVCARHGLGDRLLAFIPAHGMLELFLITVAGAAGFELARGAFGEVRFAEAGTRSFRLVAGTIPWFVLLGIVEGFLSPRMGFPTEAKLVVGMLILSVFLLYTRTRSK